jgi:hypothetical protein
MREIFTSGSVGGAPGNRCFYLEADSLKLAADLNVGRDFYGGSGALDYESQQANEPCYQFCTNCI